MRKRVLVGAALLALVGGVLLVPIRGTARSAPSARPAPVTLAPAPRPARPLSLLFIHHSVGEQLLHGKGGMQKLLEQNGYRVHSASYGSTLGEQTDIFDFPEKFRDHMPELLTTENGSTPMANGQEHDVVLFKACFPNNHLVAPGMPPGSADGPALTLENEKAALRATLPEFLRHPETLFVYLTTPPLAARTYPERLGMWLLRRVSGRSRVAKMAREAELARELATWAASEHGWLEGYPLKNVAVIDYYDLLTDHGTSNFLAYPGTNAADSHPSAEGQKKAAPVIVDAVNRAVERAGLGRPAEAAAPPSEQRVVRDAH